MKSKTFKRCIAIMLCMVIVLSGSGYLLAESLQEGTVETGTEVQPEEGTAVEEQQTTDEGTVEVEVPKEEEQENTEAPAAEEKEEEKAEAETPTTENQTAENGTEVEVVGQATSITKEIKDTDDKVMFTVVADVPENAFSAKPSELDMTVDTITDKEEESIENLIKDSLTEDTVFESCIMYRVTFKVNGVETEPAKAVEVNFKGTNLKVTDTEKTNVFYFAPAKSESGISEDSLIEIPQREAKMQELLNAGTGRIREQLEEENDFSELTVRNGVASELKMEVRRNRIYGCYTTIEQNINEEEQQENNITSQINEATILGAENQVSEYGRDKTTYTVKLWKNDKNTGKKDSTVATLTNLTASTDSNGKTVVEVNLSGKKTTASDNNYVFYGWSKVSNANTTTSDVIYCGDSSAKIKYGSNDEQTVFTYDGSSTITFSTSDFKNNTLDLYATYAVKSGLTNNSAYGGNKTVEFYVRYDGNAPYEPSTYSTSLYSSKIEVSNALYYYQHIYNNSDALNLNLKNVPSTRQLQNVLNNDRTFKNKYGNYDDSKYYVEWYVLKKEATWHVDGVIREKSQWTLRYDANTSDTVNNIIAGKQYAYGTNVTVKNTQDSRGTQIDTEPVRTGYTFVGWNTKADGTGTSFVLNNQITVKKNDFHIYKDSSDTGETASSSNSARVVTLYAQWRKNYTPPTPVVTTDKQLSHEKYIKKNDDGTYDLTLNVSGAVGTEKYENKLDVLFIMDTSGSMDKQMGNSTRFANQDAAVRAAVQKLSGKKNVDARFAIVSFDTKAGINSDWTKATESDKLIYPTGTGNYAGGGQWAGGTNYQEGLTKAKELLSSARDDATKIVVFLSDGDPTFYTDESGYVYGMGNKYDGTAMSKATTVLQSMTNMQYFYTVGVGPQDSYKHLKDLRDGVAAGITTNNFDGTDADKLKDAFNSIIKDATSLLCSGVTITDTLTDYVDLVDKNAVPTVVVKDEEGKVITKLKGKDNTEHSVDYFLETSTATVDGKTQIQLKTKNDYQLESGYTYYMTVKIQPTDTAFNEYDSTGTYPNVGDANTDEYVGTDKKPGHDTRNDGTSSRQSGFYSNVKATVKYTYNGKTKTEEYDKPVVQVETVPIEKRWVGTTPETGHVLVALLKDGQIVTDTANNNAPRIIELSKDHWTGQFVVEKASNYAVAELRQDDKGTITYDGQKYSVVEANGIVTVDGFTYKAIYSTEENNPNRIITNVENSKKIKIIKTSANSDSIMLDGAEFTLVDKDKNPVIIGENNVSNTYTSSQGVVLEAGLNAGTYTLTEIKAPSGYSKLAEPIQFEVTSTDVRLKTSSDKVIIEKSTDGTAEDMWIIKVKNDALYELPETGGNGIFWYTIGGMLLMMAAALILYKRKCGEVLDR